MAKETTKNLIESILVKHLEEHVPLNEITNAIDVMCSEEFESGNKVDKDKLTNALHKCGKYLNSISIKASYTIPAIYTNQVNIALTEVQKELEK